MARPIPHLTPASLRVLADLGARIALARGRRGLTRKRLAQRAGLTEFTLRRVEAGTGSVTLGACLAALQALGLSADLEQVAAEDRLGHDLQDAPLLAKQRRRRRSVGRSVEAALPPVIPAHLRKTTPTATPPASPAEAPAPLSTDDIMRLLPDTVEPPA